MNAIEVGQVFRFKNRTKKYVYYGETYETFYNSGGMGEYTHMYISLDSLLQLGDINNFEGLEPFIKQDKDQDFKDSIEIDTTEAPFEISTRQVTLYTVRRKKPITVTIYK